MDLISLLILLLICRCFPLYLRDDCAIEMSFIGILTIMLLKGPVVTAALVFLTTPLVIEPNPAKKHGVAHIFNTPAIKSLFNTSNLIITILCSGMVFNYFGGDNCGVALPACVLPIFSYVVVSMLVNTLLMSFLMYIDVGAKLYSTALMGFGQFVPNMIAAAPLGYFFAYLLTSMPGPYLLIFFLLPFLLARFSFKLYLDSKQQSYKVINALTAAIEAKDPYTVGHSKRVETYSELIAMQMKLSRKKIYTIKIAALFHDIGKIGINDNVLNKPDKLNFVEYDMIRKHPEISVHILESIDFYGDIKAIILAHHERYDGSGYPNGLAKDAIPVGAAIISVADAFDAMTSDRPYRRGYSIEKAVGIIRKESGKQFDPDVAAAFLTLYEQGMLKAEKTVSELIGG
jgi:putative nucleotidyltransferase with HDIG domain